MAIKISGYLTQGADGLTTIMNRHSSAMAKSIERISSGSKINHSGDDAAGKAISERMLSQIRSLDQSQQNTQNANSLLGIAESAMTSIVDIIQKMKVRAVEVSSTVVTDHEREAVSMELSQFYKAVDSISQFTQNGRYLLDGSIGEIEELAVYDIEGNQETPNELHFSDFSWKENKGMHFQVGPERGDTLVAHLGKMTANYIFKDVADENGNFNVSTIEDSKNLVKALDKSLTRAMYQLVEIGTMRERLEITSNNLQEITDDTTAALSTINDTDMAKEMTNFVTHNMLMQATQAMMAQANSNIDNFISLVRPQG